MYLDIYLLYLLFVFYDVVAKGNLVTDWLQIIILW